jgi:signal transduction histidine kinase
MTPAAPASPDPRPHGSYWTFWQNPDPDMFGMESYGWSFLLKVDLPVVIGLLGLFAIPPVQAWTGCDLRIVAAGFACHFFYAVLLNLVGFARVNPRKREFFSHLANLIAVVSIPLSSDKALIALWTLYPLIVWMDGFGSPKSAASLLTSFLLPWADPLYHLGEPAFAEKAVLAGIVSATGVVIYLIASYFTSWGRAAQRRKAEAASLRATAEERARIGRNLHGTLGAALSEISLWHEVALAGGAEGAAAGPLERAQARARSALTELRSLVEGIDGERTTLAGAAERVRVQAGGLCEAGGVAFEMQVSGDDAVSQASSYHAAKIVIESVTNAVRHGRARRVSVKLSVAPLDIRVEDDGAGFAPDTAARGHGLRSLAEHASALGGTLAIDSRPGEGTRVRVKPAGEKA